MGRSLSGAGWWRVALSAERATEGGRERVAYDIGDLIDGHYRVEKRYTGGMAYVYIVKDEVVNKRFAIKQLLESHARLPVLRERFIREAAVWVLLDYHPNIVQAHTYHQSDTGPMLILEYVDGPSLEKLLRVEGRLAIPQAVSYARQVCRAMQWVTSREIPERGRGVLHRDLKPSNILITRTNQVKVTDFGLAKILGDAKLTKEDQFLGTAVYSSPEQLRGAGNVTVASDIYSLGAVLYQMLCGRPPFKGRTQPELFFAIQNEDPIPPDHACDDVHPVLSGIVMKCLAKDPRQRYGSFEELDQALAEIEPLLQTPSAWRCPACGYASRKRHRRCPICHTGTAAAGPEAEASWQCSCGELVPSGATECPSCGRLVPLLEEGKEKTAGSSAVPPVGVADDRSEETLALTFEWDVPSDQPAVVVLHEGGGCQIVPVNKMRFRIGRERNMHLVLRDDTVSKHHVYLIRLACGWLAVSRRPNNLAAFNGWQLSQRLLRNGDLMRLGTTWLVFSDPAPDQEPLKWLPGSWRERLDATELWCGGASPELPPIPAGERAECEVRAPEREPVRSAGPPIVIGAAPVCQVRVKGAGAAPVHALIFWHQKGPTLWRLCPGTELRVDGRDVQTCVLREEARVDVGVVPIKVVPSGNLAGPACYFSRLVTSRQPRLALTAIAGPQRGQTAVLVPGESYTLGRDKQADIIITTDTYVSRRHLRLTCGERQLQLKDLGSRNGFFLNQVHRRDMAVAKPGDLILIGRTTLALHYELIPHPW